MTNSELSGPDYSCAVCFHEEDDNTAQLSRGGRGLSRDRYLIAFHRQRVILFPVKFHSIKEANPTFLESCFENHSQLRQQTSIRLLLPLMPWHWMRT